MGVSYQSHCQFKASRAILHELFIFQPAFILRMLLAVVQNRFGSFLIHKIESQMDGDYSVPGSLQIG